MFGIGKQPIEDRIKSLEENLQRVNNAFRYQVELNDLFKKMLDKLVDRIK